MFSLFCPLCWTESGDRIYDEEIGRPLSNTPHQVNFLIPVKEIQLTGYLFMSYSNLPILFYHALAKEKEPETIGTLSISHKAIPSFAVGKMVSTDRVIPLTVQITAGWFNKEENKKTLVVSKEFRYGSSMSLLGDEVKIENGAPSWKLLSVLDNAQDTFSTISTEDLLQGGLTEKFFLPERGIDKLPYLRKGDYRIRIAFSLQREPAGAGTALTLVPDYNYVEIPGELVTILHANFPTPVSRG